MIIHINWYGPYTPARLGELNNEDYDYGVYQIYGAHPVYGSNVLLYIGKAEGQTFSVRLNQEEWIRYLPDAENVQIYVGRLAGKATPNDSQWCKEIDLSEKLLIHTHKPAFNSQNIRSIPDKALQDIHIVNWYNHRDLMSEVSGARWTSKYDDIPDYDDYGKHK
jgi:hypothetical protein